LIGTIAAVFAGAISMLAHMAQWAAIFGGGRSDNERGGSPIAVIAMAIIAPIAAMMIQMAISRSREYLADAGGAKFHGNPNDLANALRKLHSAAEDSDGRLPAWRVCSSSIRSLAAADHEFVLDASSDGRERVKHEQMVA
jgi:Zn-dependent protease with chaperone function